MARYKTTDNRDYIEACKFLDYAREHGFDVELKRFYQKRSGKQNRYLYFCLQWFAHEYNCTVVEAKEVFLKRIAAPHIFEREMRLGDNVIKYYRSTADLDTVEMMSALENFRAYAGMNGIQIPDASDDESIRFCEREIEKTIQYGT